MNDYSRGSDSDATQEPFQHDWRDGETATWNVIDAISEVTGTPPTELQPLYETIDPDALDQLIESSSENPSRSAETTVSFYHEGCAVTIEAGGQLTVRRRPTDR